MDDNTALELFILQINEPDRENMGQMTLDDIERLLGETVTEDVQDSVTQALAAAERLSDPKQGRDAVQELLIAMLAAVLITPRDGAKLRANYAAERLLAVVDASLIEGRPS